MLCITQLAGMVSPFEILLRVRFEGLWRARFDNGGNGVFVVAEGGIGSHPFLKSQTTFVH